MATYNFRLNPYFKKRSMIISRASKLVAVLKIQTEGLIEEQQENDDSEL